MEYFQSLGAELFPRYPKEAKAQKQQHLITGQALIRHKGSVSRKTFSLEMDFSSLITLVTIVFSMLKITRGLKIVWETGQRWLAKHAKR